MKSIHRWSLFAAAAVSLGGGFLVASQAQSPEDRMMRPPEATIYRDAAYKGPAVFIGDGYLADEVRKANPDAQMVGWGGRAGRFVDRDDVFQLV